MFASALPSVLADMASRLSVPVQPLGGPPSSQRRRRRRYFLNSNTIHRTSHSARIPTPSSIPSPSRASHNLSRCTSHIYSNHNRCTTIHPTANLPHHPSISSSIPSRCDHPSNSSPIFRRRILPLPRHREREKRQEVCRLPTCRRCHHRWGGRQARPGCSNQTSLRMRHRHRPYPRRIEPTPHGAQPRNSD